MHPLISTLSPGEFLCVAWVDWNDEPQTNRVRIQEVYEPEEDVFVADVCNDETRFQLVEPSPEQFIVVDEADDPNDRHVIDDPDALSGRPVIAVEQDPAALMMESKLRKFLKETWGADLHD